MYPRPLALLAFTLIALTATGCTRQETVQTGRFADDAAGGLPYSGLRYEAQPSGLAGEVAGGTFRFQSRDNITFYLGDFPLGSFDTAGNVAAVTLEALQVAGLSDAEYGGYVVSLRAMLRSLDSDGETGNGVSVSADDQAAFAGIHMTGKAIDTLRHELAALSVVRVVGVR
ncbi:MAG: hypothetical protein ACOY33_01035 [Pseudomonadota bacterium]